MPDVERLTRKLERRKVSLSDMCQLYRASSKLPHICAALAAHEGPHTQLLATKCVHQLTLHPNFPKSVLLLPLLKDCRSHRRCHCQYCHYAYLPCDWANAYASAVAGANLAYSTQQPLALFVRLFPSPWVADPDAWHTLMLRSSGEAAAQV